VMTRFAQSPTAAVLSGVSHEAWLRFAAALEAQPAGAVTSTGGLGAYEFQPRRLVEMKAATNLCYEGSDGRTQTCDFVAPLTRKLFLADLRLQYKLFVRSIQMYDRQLTTGELKIPKGATRAETLAALHVGGRGALKDWANLFERTRVRCNAVREIF